MNYIKWHEQLSVKIRTSVLVFIVLILMDNSTIFNIELSDTLNLSSNMSTWLTWKITGGGFMDSFAYPLVGFYLLLTIQLYGVLKAPYRNIWVLEFTIMSTATLIFMNSFMMMDAGNNSVILLNSSFQCIKLIPLLLAWRWTKQLAIPVTI